MKKNTKFLLIYVAILFSFAIVLILFAGLTQNNYAKEIEESQGIKQNLVKITEQYQTLTDSMKTINDELQESKLEIENQKQQITKLTSQTEITNILISALELSDRNQYKQALKKIEQLDKEKLTEEQLYIYNKIKR